MDKPIRAKTSFSFDHKLLKRLKLRAVEEETSVTAILEKLAREYLDKPKAER